MLTRNAGEHMLAEFYRAARRRDPVSALPWYGCEPAALPMESWTLHQGTVWPHGPISDLVPDGNVTFTKAMLTVLRRRCLEEFRRTGDVRGNLGAILDVVDAQQAALAAVLWPVDDAEFNPADLDGVVNARRLEALYDGAPPSNWELSRWRTIAKANRGEREQFHWVELLRIAAGETGEMFVPNHHDGHCPLGKEGPYATARDARRALAQEYDVEFLDSAWR